MKLQPYLFFEGRCEESLNFYKKALGAKIDFMMRYHEAPVPPQPKKSRPIPGEKILHATVSVGETTFHASDGDCTGKPNFKGFALTLSVKTVAQSKKLFTALTRGGKVRFHLSKTFFSPSFGMATDKFGVPWMVMAAQPLK